MQRRPEITVPESSEIQPLPLSPPAHHHPETNIPPPTHNLPSLADNHNQTNNLALRSPPCRSSHANHTRVDSPDRATKQFSWGSDTLIPDSQSPSTVDDSHIPHNIWSSSRHPIKPALTNLNYLSVIPSTITLGRRSSPIPTTRTMVTLGISPITLGFAELHLPTEDLSISDTTSFPSDHELRCATNSRRSGQRCVCNALSPMFYLPTSLHGFPCSALLDSGASDNFISDSLVTQLNLHRHQLHINIHFRTANGERLPCTHYVRVRLFLPTFSFRVCFRIAPITPQLILGCLFL